mmetsp:Transcript_29460/g.40467  ORF Transcript_29460/g.40467 Transcript_29460/m.40467 type:complete len:99 (+) Transcript_29460:29-325(+)
MSWRRTWELQWMKLKKWKAVGIEGANIQQEFFIEVNQVNEDRIDEGHSEDDEEDNEMAEESDQDEAQLPPQPVMNKRGRKITPNKMIGEVQKRKIQCC